MMILTMTAPEAPTTTANDHRTTATKTVCESGRSVVEGSSSSSSSSSMNSISGSCCSLNSSCSSLETSCPNTATKIKKRVSFGLQQTAYFSPEQILSKQERKNECWYSESELSVSRDEARMAIQALHHQLQMDAMAATTGSATDENRTSSVVSNEYGSWVLKCPHDETKIVCLRGIEKYADAAAKYAGQKRHVDSVLQQQSLNNEDVHVALVSRTLSQPFKEVARYYAARAAEELDRSMKLEQEREEKEQKQREEVATVLLLIMGQQEELQHQQLKASPNTPSSASPPKLSQTSPIVTPRESYSGKRPFPTSPLCEKRNVKPCIRAIQDR